MSSKRSVGLWFIFGTALVAAALSLWHATRPRPTGAELARSQVIADLDAWLGRKDAIDDPEYPSRLLQRADALAAQGEVWKALFDYEVICKEFPASKEFVQAVTSEREIGVRIVRGKLAVPQAGGRKRTQSLGEELLIRTAERLPGSADAEEAVFELAQFYEREGDRESALTAFRKHLQMFPGSSRQPQVEARIEAINRPR